MAINEHELMFARSIILIGPLPKFDNLNGSFISLMSSFFVLGVWKVREVLDENN